ncbi:MAG: U32 family peptidase [Clostridia bacterium]|nr:U32 family peptidase [Clostridia bacterium]
MSKDIIIPEVLSPAGDMEALDAALRFGADAVYLAYTEFGMRTAPKNFDADGLKTAVEKVHKAGKKLYLTLNTLPRFDQIERLPELLSYAQSVGVDAFIIADLGVFELAKKYAPSVSLHVSTQAGIVNHETAKAFYNMGAERVVLARELSLEDIAQIRARIPKELELECFVHGAMCVSFSGRCLISSYLTGRDANRGDCAQPCRWKYHLYEENREGQFFPVEEKDGGTFLYNSKDMCMIEHIPELIKAGVNSLKIEGRAKTAYYTAVTTNAYRKAVDEYLAHKEGEYTLSPWIKEELEKISHRAYSTGFYMGTEPGQNTESGGYIRHYDLVAFCESSEDLESVITQRNKFYVGDTLDVLPPSGFAFETKALSLVNEKGESVESTPHPMERLTLITDKNIPAGSMLRVKKH